MVIHRLVYAIWSLPPWGNLINPLQWEVLPLWEVPLTDLLTEEDLEYLGLGRSWRTDFWTGLISVSGGNGPWSLPRRRAPDWPRPSSGAGGSHHLDYGWGIDEWWLQIQIKLIFTMGPFINSLSSLYLPFNLCQEFSQKCEYSKSSTVVNKLWDGMRNEQNSELNT